ncbi:MAG: thioredoxin domain-containing protein, partial [Pirellulales bacterium]
MTIHGTHPRTVLATVFGLAVVMLSAPAIADEPTSPWLTDLETAKQTAHSSRRLVLVHFWAPWCSACTKMENEVYAQPGYHQALSGMYVPVKINSDANPELLQQYGVTALPTEVIITPTGQIVDRVQGIHDPQSHMARLTQAARRVNPAAGPGMAGQPVAAPQPMAAAGPQPPAANDTGMVAPWNSAPAPAQQPGAPVQGAAFQAAAAAAPAGAAPQAGPPGQPAPGLEGYCPVDLCERHLWTRGKQEFGAIHRGRVYLFSSAVARDHFLANPDR